MARDFTDLKSGDELHPYHINEIYKELRRWRKASGDGGIIIDRANSTTVPPIFGLRSKAGTKAASYIQITSVASSVFGGYPWQGVRWTNPLSITAAGTGYSAGNVTFSPTYASGTDAPTATYEVDATTGALNKVNVTHAGSNMTALTASVSGGTGATLLCILDQGSLRGGGWVDIAGQDGSIGANDYHGNPTPGDMAYEASGCLSLGARIADSGGHYYHEATYPAIRDAGGRLLFFCRTAFLARTKVISSYPTSASVFYGMESLEIVGPIPTEGSTVSVSALSTTFLAYNLGSAVPPVGTHVICVIIPSANGPFFAFRYDA